LIPAVEERLNNNFTIYDCFFLHWSALLISQVALAIFLLRALPSTRITDSKCRIYFFNVPKLLIFAPSKNTLNGKYTQDLQQPHPRQGSVHAPE
jgi:hypothetical protein